jgi:hypothetical protein
MEDIEQRSADFYVSWRGQILEACDGQMVASVLEALLRYVQRIIQLTPAIFSFKS